MLQIDRIEAEDVNSRAFRPLSDQKKAQYLSSALEWALFQIEANPKDVDQESLEKCKHLLKFCKAPFNWATMQTWL